MRKLEEVLSYLFIILAGLSLLTGILTMYYLVWGNNSELAFKVLMTSFMTLGVSVLALNFLD